MASNLNSEFNYRYQVIGSTPWEKLKTLKGFLVGRKRAAVLEQVADLKYKAKLSELKHLKLIAELYTIVEPTRIPGYTDDQMFEANANNEFTVTIGREIQAEIIANGRPSPAKLLNAMSNPQTLESLKLVGLVPKETMLLEQKDIVDALKLNNINEPKLIE